MKTCLFPNCNKPVYARGLCNSHYHAAYRIISLGQTTWETLVSKGKAKENDRKIDNKWFLE